MLGHYVSNVKRSLKDSLFTRYFRIYLKPDCIFINCPQAGLKCGQLVKCERCLDRVTFCPPGSYNGGNWQRFSTVSLSLKRKCHGKTVSLGLWINPWTQSLLVYHSSTNHFFYHGATIPHQNQSNCKAEQQPCNIGLYMVLRLKDGVYNKLVELLNKYKFYTDLKNGRKIRRNYSSQKFKNKC